MALVFTRDLIWGAPFEAQLFYDGVFCNVQRYVLCYQGREIAAGSSDAVWAAWRLLVSHMVEQTRLGDTHPG